MESLTGLLGLALLGTLYLLPCIIAAARHHHQTAAIAALTLLAGWTGIGWLVGIVWSMTEVHATTGTERPAV